MTDDSMALADLLQKTDDGDFLRSVAEAVLQMLNRYMQVEVMAELSTAVESTPTITFSAKAA
nr:hypothetical protein [Azospirillum cavernae]